MINRDLLKQVNQTSESQFPFATILSCIDSRTSAELIFDQGLGDIFSIRIAGNILNDDILASMEYACGIVKSKIILVLGHTNCGAIISACNNLEFGQLPVLLNKIRPAIENETTVIDSRNGDNKVFVDKVSTNNILNTIRNIRERSPVLNDLEKKGEIILSGAMYQVETGEVMFFDDENESG